MTRHPRYATRRTVYCDRCETTVYADDIHSCHDAKALREQQERERTLTALERAVVEKAKQFARIAWVSQQRPALYRTRKEKLCEAVRALNAASAGKEADHPCR